MLLNGFHIDRDLEATKPAFGYANGIQTILPWVRKAISTRRSIVIITVVEVKMTLLTLTWRIILALQLEHDRSLWPHLAFEKITKARHWWVKLAVQLYLLAEKSISSLL